eukprot:6476520-Amphidinium_carterae.1
MTSVLGRRIPLKTTALSAQPALSTTRPVSVITAVTPGIALQEIDARGDHQSVVGCSHAAASLDGFSIEEGGANHHRLPSCGIAAALLG